MCDVCDVMCDGCDVCDVYRELSLIGDEWVKENRLRANYTENFIQIQRYGEHCGCTCVVLHTRASFC